MGAKIVRGVANGEWRVASGEWRVAGGEWRVARLLILILFLFQEFLERE
jgi:hypothetical protein